MEYQSQYLGKLACLLSSMVPNTTPDIFNWVLHHRANGMSLENIKEGLMKAGWDSKMADTIILYAREDSQFSYKPYEESNKKEESMNSNYNGDTEKNKIKKEVNMPGILFENYPNTYDLGDRVVNILVSIDHPRVVVFDNFLSDEECEKLINISKEKLERSKTMGASNYAIPEQNETRTSSGTFLKKKENPILEIVDKRISKLINWDVKNLGEDLQILKYTPGQEYKPHYDYFDREFVEKNRYKTGWGQRVGTVLLYLNEVEEGGQTIFPETGINVHPKKGSALFFAYKDNKDSLSLHGGSPVITGVKWVATKWLRTK